MPHPLLRPYLSAVIETNPWIEPWQRWDAIHYQVIADFGYQANDTLLFTPPLFPILIKLFDFFTNMGSLVAGILVSNLSFLLSLIVLYHIVVEETGSHPLATRSLIYLVSFPTAFFFMAGYTESLYLLTAELSLLLFLRRKWAISGLCGAAAALTRLTGILLIAPLGYAAWQEARRSKLWQPWIAPILTLVGGGIFSLYIGLALDKSIWAPWIIQTIRFRGGVCLPGWNLIMAFQNIFAGSYQLADLFDVSFLLLFIASTPWIIRRLPPVYGVYQIAYLLLYLSRISNIQPLLSTARYVLVLFPAFITFSHWGQTPRINRLFLYTFWLGLLLLSGQFALWGWVG
ncbi:MAG: hypothetical protein JXB15_04135 [Anaerolineales bacterium]|nr:hypothetical protein [Anaerolineales bacterium]